MILVFRIIIVILGLIGFFTGANDLINGASVKGDFGDLGAVVNKPMLNFTIRFLGAIWAGFGALLILFSTDLKRYDVALIMALVIVIIGGIGRFISTQQFGIDPINKTTVYFILATELVVVPLMLSWYLIFIRTKI